MAEDDFAGEFEVAGEPVALVDELHEVPAVAVLDASEPEAVQQVSPVEAQVTARGLYMVRIPKPVMDNATDDMKKLQAEFQAHVTKLKAMNGKLAAKRDEVRGYRKQMDEARGLKETSEPEYQEKLAHMKQLKDLRHGFVSRIQEIKNNMQGIDVKSEAELEEKVRQLENRISHEGLTLREEKMVVAQITKLNSQRGKIKEFEGSRSTLAELESEAQKIRGIMQDMDGEFSAIKNERDATNKVVQEIWTKLQAARKDLDELEADKDRLSAAKDEVLRALDSMREETNSSMVDFRENRKLSLAVRDLVAAGQVEEARALVDAQVDEWIPKLCEDAAYRKEYVDMWSQQRKYIVSELLPKSGVPLAPAAGGPGRGPAGGRGTATKAPLEARGAEKAKDIIAQLMSQASTAAAAAKAKAAALAGHANGHVEDNETNGAVPAAVAPATALAPAPVIKTEPAKLVTNAAAAAAAVFGIRADMPKVADVEFVPPVIEKVQEQVSKEQLREEQMRKATEAEERKRRRAEQAERKKLQAVETAKRLESERRERDAACRAAAAAAKAPPPAQPVQPASEQAAEGSADDGNTSGQAAVPAPAAAAAYPRPTPWEKRQMVASAKRPKSKATSVRHVTSYWEQYQGWIVFGVVMLLVVIMATWHFLA